jgi:lipopolysaccharide transport system permease protein
MVIPVATVGKGLFDYMIALVIVLVIMAYYGIAPGFQVITFPVWMVLVFFAAAGISMWTSAVSVKYRDLPYTIPFLVQMLFWISPVAYGSQVIPDRYTYLYSLNPMYSVIEGFRWCMLGTPFPEPKMVVISLAMIFVLFFSALIYFRNMERHFADLI